MENLQAVTHQRWLLLKKSTLPCNFIGRPQSFQKLKVGEFCVTKLLLKEPQGRNPWAVQTDLEIQYLLCQTIWPG